MKFKKGFTLSEILIALAIVGVVAAVTIPTMMRNLDLDTQSAADHYKKTLSTIDQATKMMVMKRSSRNLSGYADANAVMADYANYIHFKSVSSASATGMNEVTYSVSDFKSDCSGSVTMDTLGADFSTAGATKTITKACWLVTFDVNGSKAPGAYGRDKFRVAVGKYGIKTK